MFYNVGRALFHQRWSVELAPAYTDWSRPSCHGRIYKATGKPPLPWVRFPATTPVKDYIETAGGWHDAGDFNPVGHIGHLFSALLALRACEGAGLGTGLVDGQLTIPESGNGIPDLLDEALSGIQVWVDLQQPDGSIYSGAESWHDVGYMLANEDRDQGPWTYDPDVSFTTFCAGLFAHAAHLVRAFHPGKADRLRKAAVDAYGWATANGALRLTGSQSVTLYAASELYRLTGSTSYKQDYETAWDSFPYQRGPMPGNGWPRWRFKDVLLTGDCFVSFIKKEPGNVRSARDLRGGPQAFKSQAARAARTITDSTFAHRNGRFASGLAWGAGTAMARFGEMLFLGRELQDLIPLSAAERQEVFDAISLLNDYTFGCNPLGMCWVTGLGSRRPMQPLSVEWLVHVKVRQLPPLPGITIFGPTSPPGSGYYRPLQAAFYPAMNRQTLAVPPYLQYCDSRAYVNCNEYSTLTIVSTVLVVATLIAQKGWTPPPSWKPGGKEVRNPLPPFTSD
jgi:endoglucanase